MLIDICIATPERLAVPEFMRLLGIVYDAGELNRLVVDEVRINTLSACLALV